MSRRTARSSHNQSPPVRPLADQTITYISVVNGRKRTPSTGRNHLPPKALLNNAGRASQTKMVARRGKHPAKIANRQPMCVSPMVARRHVLVPCVPSLGVRAPARINLIGGYAAYLSAL